MNKEEKSSNKCPICGRSTHEESKYCIFHAHEEEKCEKEFLKKLKKYFSYIKKNKKEYNFYKFIFIGNINFKENLNLLEDLDISTLRFADFRKATFLGNTNFRGLTFHGIADFRDAIFKGNTYFDNAVFKGNSNFGNSVFEGTANFEKTVFEGTANFEKTIFEKDADFEKAIFHEDESITGISNFNEAHFKSDTSFNYTTFQGSIRFQNTTFQGNTQFRKVTFISGDNTIFSESNFQGNTYFEFASPYIDIFFNEIKVLSGKRLSIFIIDKKTTGRLLFNRASLENVYLDMDLAAGVWIDFKDVLLKNTRMKKSQIINTIIQERKDNFSEAREVYLILKNNFHSIGQYGDERWAYNKERDMERKSLHKSKKYSKWLWSCLLNTIYGYGERPLNVVISAISIILLFAYFFTLIGIGIPEIIELHGKIHPIPGTDMRIASEGILQNTKIMQFSNSLYFSLITFTTLGYGDFRPLEGIGRILAGSEAFIGAFMMALFVYTFARRTGGR